MKIATLLFTYNRSYHTKRVLSSLKQNTILPQKLLIFQDGLKEKKDIYEWKKVNDLIKNINWCDKEIIVSKENKGLSVSIISGIEYAFKEYEALIVLEDDCVPAISFIAFMNQCFEKYEHDKNIYSISGYSWPINLIKDDYDIYGCGRISSWGWGTWKDRWRNYNKDNTILKRLKENCEKSRNLAVWGNDCEQMLIDNLIGKNDSWAIYWGLIVIENNGICINPYKSLIENIGMDGTGVHCDNNNRFNVEVSNESISKFRLPDKINLLSTTEEAFVDLYGSFTAVNKRDDSKENVLIYGVGNFYLHNERDINKKYNIEAFIDKRKKGWFAGKKIISIKKILQYNYSKIIIMIQDIQECINVVKILIKEGILAEQIILGHSIFGEYSNKFTNIRVLYNGSLLLKLKNIQIKVNSKDEFNNVKEVLLDQIYNYFLNDGKKDVILDIGMNIGDSILYFLQNDNVKKIYGYEPFRRTFELAKENLKLHLKNTDRIEIFQYGISNKNEKRIIDYNSDMSCDQSTISETCEKAYEFYLKWGIIEEKNKERELIIVKKASDVFKPIIKKHHDNNIILKMDCNGEEYNILEELLKEGILSEISFIMLKWHYKGKELLLQYLKQAGFSYWCNDKEKNMGMIYAYSII